jgi:hypothetical protein
LVTKAAKIPVKGAKSAGTPPETLDVSAANIRQTFVLGIFPLVPAASEAIEHLADTSARDCDALLVSDGIPHLVDGIRPHARALRCTASDLTGFGLTSRRLVDATPPFKALWESIRTPEGLKSGTLGTQRLFQHLVQRVSSGAAVVIVRTVTPEQRLATSRTLLEAGCEVLLTHEITAPPN